LKQVRKISFLSLFFLLSFFSCTDEKEVEVETLARVYVDLLVVEDFYLDSDSLEFKRTEVFNNYSVSKAEYDSAFKMFSSDKKKWDFFFDLSNTYLDTLKSDLKKSAKPKE
jgi:hypothetical protein